MKKDTEAMVLSEKQGGNDDCQLGLRKKSYFMVL